MSMALTVALALSGASLTQISFSEVGAARGLLPYLPAPGMTTGVIAADFDGDGDPDIYVPSAHNAPNQLYRNLGNGSYEEVAAALGVASLRNDRTALWFDFDGDDDLDLAIVTDTFADELLAETNTLRIMRNDGTSFVEVHSIALEPGNDLHGGGFAAGDLDGDGDLDLVSALWEARPRVLINNADGTFTEAGAATGIGAQITTKWQPLFHDMNGDGCLDVLVSYDFSENNLYMNPGTGAPPLLQDVAQQVGIGTAFNEMGVAPGDPDRDGDLDFYMTNIHGLDPGTGVPEFNVLFRNDTVDQTIAFTETAQAAGVDAGGVGWGAVFADFDNDGWEDLAEANTREFPTDVSTKLWRNCATGVLEFEDQSATSGMATIEPCTALMTFDSDGDGDLDLLMPSLDGSLHLLENQLTPAGASYLVVRPRMPGMNRRAIGATVRATMADGSIMVRLITAGSSFASQQPAEAFFGLGAATSVAELRITWPDATETIMRNVAADQVLVVESPCPCGFAPHDIDGDGDADVADLHAITRTPTDVNDDGSADQLDVACVERYVRRFEQRERSETRRHPTIRRTGR